MKEVKLFTEEEKEKLKERIKDFENVESYQMMKIRFMSELNRIDKAIVFAKGEQVEELKECAEKHIKQLENYRKDLIDCLGFIFGYKDEQYC